MNELNTLSKKIGEANFQAELLENPHKTLLSIGINFPTSIKIKVLRDTSECLNWVIPTSNTTQQITDEELNKIAAGEIVVAATVGALGAGAVASVVTLLGLYWGGVLSST